MEEGLCDLAEPLPTWKCQPELLISHTPKITPLGLLEALLKLQTSGFRSEPLNQNLGCGAFPQVFWSFVWPPQTETHHRSCSNLDQHLRPSLRLPSIQHIQPQLPLPVPALQLTPSRTPISRRCWRDPGEGDFLADSIPPLYFLDLHGWVGQPGASSPREQTCTRQQATAMSLPTRPGPRPWGRRFQAGLLVRCPVSVPCPATGILLQRSIPQWASC